MSKDHFLPQVYIDKFSFDGVGNVYTKNINRPNSKIKQLNKSAICYEPGLYDIKNPIFPESEINDLEKRHKDYEDKFNDCYRIIGKKNYNTNQDFIDLISIIIFIKMRNKSRYQFAKQEENRDIILKNVFKNLSNESKSASDFFKYNYEYFVNKYDENINEIINVSQRNQLVNQSDNSRILINYILSSIIEIYYDDFERFISCDDPGFSIHPDGSPTSEFFFGSASFFIFPLSPKYCLFVQLGIKFNDGIIFYKEADINFINLVNFHTIKLASKYIFSDSFEKISNSFENFNTLKK